jgi:ABC-2 type transport system ATP-binding protein
VQRICNRIALIDRGEIKMYGELKDLRHKMGRSSIVVEVSSAVSDSLIDDLKKQTRLGFFDFRSNNLFFESEEGAAEVSDIIGYLAGQGVKIENVGKREASLEDLYSTILKEVEGE